MMTKPDYSSSIVRVTWWKHTGGEQKNVPPAYLKFDPELDEENIETDYIYAIYEDKEKYYIVGRRT